MNANGLAFWHCNLDGPGRKKPQARGPARPTDHPCGHLRSGRPRKIDNLSQVFPYLSQVFPYLSQVFPYLRQVFPFRSNFSAIQYDGNLYVMGGHDGTSTTKSVEVLRAGSNTFEAGPDLLVKCSAFRTAVLRNWNSIKFVDDKMISDCLDEEIEVSEVGMDLIPEEDEAMAMDDDL
uniref:Kelch repeat protein n=1 Tax=Bursaphelenchus xylophilus TaxID=6326 RepID=A0A1I7RKU6_BURXY